MAKTRPTEDIRSLSEFRVEELELLRDVHQAEKELAAGKGVAHTRARSQVLAGLRRCESASFGRLDQYASAGPNGGDGKLSGHC